MVNILGIVITTLIVTILGGGLGYWIWLRTRPKKETWNAKVYQLGRGIRPLLRDKKTGEIVGAKIKIKDLIPYSTDIIEKVEKGAGMTVYRLQKLNKSTPPVDSHLVEFWGEGKKEVSCLLIEGEVTLLQKGYDSSTGDIILQPISQSKLNLIKSEMAIRKDRLTPTKDILSAISPWIVAGICMIGLVVLGYVMIGGFIEISENLETASMNWNTRSGTAPTVEPVRELGQQKVPVDAQDVVMVEG